MPWMNKIISNPVHQKYSYIAWIHIQYGQRLGSEVITRRIKTWCVINVSKDNVLSSAYRALMVAARIVNLRLYRLWLFLQFVLGLGKCSYSLCLMTNYSLFLFIKIFMHHQDFHWPFPLPLSWKYMWLCLAFVILQQSFQVSRIFVWLSPTSPYLVPVFVSAFVANISVFRI